MKTGTRGRPRKGLLEIDRAREDLDLALELLTRLSPEPTLAHQLAAALGVAPSHLVVLTDRLRGRNEIETRWEYVPARIAVQTSSWEKAQQLAEDYFDLTYPEVADEGR